MRVVAIVQARLGSSRLPGKVLADIGGRPMLAHVIERLRRATRLHEIVVATSDMPSDELVAELSRKLGAMTFRGSECDVLDRFYQAATQFAADVVVRVTADCPLVDPRLVDAVVGEVVDRHADCSAVVPLGPRAFPRGFDCEAFTWATLERTWREARAPHERSHVTPFIYEHPEYFRLSALEADRDYRHLRLTVDTIDDLLLVKALYPLLSSRGAKFTWRDCVELLQANPSLGRRNAHVRQQGLLAG